MKWTIPTILMSAAAARKDGWEQSVAMMNPRHSKSRMAAELAPDTITPESSTAQSPHVAIERYDFRACPFQKWVFPSTLSVHADLLSMSNSSVESNPWSCGRQSGLTLKEHLQAHLETPVLGEFWSNSFHTNRSSRAFVVSLWLRPDQVSEDPGGDSNLYPILTWTTMDHDYHYIASLGCPGYELQIALYLDHILIRYRDHDEAQSCKVLYLRQVSFSDLSNSTSNHLLLTLAAGTTSVHLNGQILHRDLENSFNSTPTDWWNATQLQVFGVRGASERFRGALHEISMFDSVLTDSEVSQLYKNGLGSFDEDAGLVTNYSVAMLELTTPNPPAIVVPQASVEPVSIDLVDLDDALIGNTTLNLIIEFTGLPVNGTLSIKQHPDEAGAIVAKLSRLHIARNNSGYAVMYNLSSPEFFNSPQIDALGEDLHFDGQFAESFTYRLVIVDDDGFPVASVPEEKTVVQAITVQHVNHRPSLHIPKEAVLPAQTSTISAELLCQGIRVDDHQDHDLNLVRVDVTTKQGRLTLDPQYRHLADFLSCRDRSQSAWQCLGNGVADRHMTFVTVPSNVEYILRDLRYEGFVPGTADEIIVAIYDGADDQECLSYEEHEENSIIVGSNGWSSFTGTLFTGCFQVNGTIKVPAMESLLSSGGDYSEDDDETNILGIPNSDFSSFDLADLLFWIILSIFICAICICCGRFLSLALRLFRARGAAIAIRDDSSDSRNHVPTSRRMMGGDRSEPETDQSSDDISNRVVVFVQQDNNQHIAAKHSHSSSCAQGSDDDDDSISHDDDDDDSSITIDCEPGQISL